MNPLPAQRISLLQRPTIVVLALIIIDLAILHYPRDVFSFFDLIIDALVLAVAAWILEHAQYLVRDAGTFHTRRGFQFSLSTAILVAMLTGLLMLLNFETLTASRSDYYGFPFTALLFMRENELLKKRVWNQFGQTEWFYAPWLIVGNVVFVALCNISAVLICDGFVRFSQHRLFLQRKTLILTAILLGSLFWANMHYYSVVRELQLGENYHWNARGWPLQWDGLNKTNWPFAAIDLFIAGLLTTLACYLMETIQFGESAFLKKTNAYVRIHTSTALAIAFVLLFLIWMNLHPQSYVYIESYYVVSGENEGQSGRYYCLANALGWPLQFNRDEALKGYSQDFRFFAFVADVATGVAIVSGIGFLCERVACLKLRRTTANKT